VLLWALPSNANLWTGNGQRLEATRVCHLQRHIINSTISPSEIIIPNATVPGGIFSDLMNSDIIPDIFYGYGDTNYSWVGLSDWTYASEFEGLVISYVIPCHETSNCS
jgi:hypothetical protein